MILAEISYEIGIFAHFTHQRPWHWPWIGSYGIPSYITHWPLPTYQILFKLEKTFCGRTDIRTDIETGFTRLLVDKEYSYLISNWWQFTEHRRLQSVQNAAARLTFGIRRLEHIMYALASLHWLRVPERIIIKFAVLTYRAVNGSAPDYLSSYFTRVANVPSRLRLRSSNSDQLMVPSYNLTTVGRRAFPVFAANLWNSLPANLTSAPSLTWFSGSGSVSRPTSFGVPTLT